MTDSLWELKEGPKGEKKGEVIPIVKISAKESTDHSDSLQDLE